MSREFSGGKAYGQYTLREMLKLISKQENQDRIVDTNLHLFYWQKNEDIWQFEMLERI